MDDRINFIIEQLRQLPPSRGLEIKGKTAWVRCPSHKNGLERTPSLAINLDSRRAVPGCGFCFAGGCHIQGNWKLMAELLGLQDFARETNKVKHIYPLPIPDRNQLLAAPLHLPRGMRFVGNWRGISSKLLQQLDVRVINTELGSRLLLPAKVNGRLHGWISCSLNGEEPKYLYLSGPWIKNTLFPYDLVKAKWQGQPIYLVEGSRDSLNMIQNNTPALAVLGSKTWSHTKKMLLLSLQCPAVFIMFDPDEAGEHAAQQIELDLHNQVKTIRVQLPRNPYEKIDPGNLLPMQIQFINKLMVQRLRSIR